MAMLACAAVLSASASEITPVIQRSAPGNCLVTSFPVRTAQSAPAAAGAATAQLTVSVVIDNDRNQEVANVLAISANPQHPAMYEFAKSGNVYSGTVEAGVYDLVVNIKSDDEDTQILLFEEDVEVSGTKRVMVNQRNATISTVIDRMSPSGIELMLPSTDGYGNCSVVDHIMMLHHNDFGTLLQDEVASFRRCCTHVSVNVIPQRFSLTRMDIYVWNQGPVFTVIPIDFTKEHNGPTADGWHSVSATFAETPMSAAWRARQEPPQFNMTGFFVVAGKHCNAYVGVGNYNHEFPTDRMYYWAPEGYGGYYEYYPVLRDNLIEMADASVSSMPYRMTEAGLRPSGLNLAGDGNLMLHDGKLPDSGHPCYSDPLPDDAILANAVPALVCLPSSTNNLKWDNGFLYDFTGRYGEKLGINSFNFTDILTVNELAQIGDYRRTLSIKRDGTEICSWPGGFARWLDWGNGEMYSMEMTMSNVLIDGETEGINNATLTYSPADGYIPTLTSLQLRDNGIAADRFTKCADATLELTAATFSFAGYMNFSFKAPSAVKAEYAPHGSDEFSELPLNEVPENFYLPGYGTYYRASLGGVDRESADKWYDLRITVNGAEGSAQTQVLSPAFRLESPSGVDNIETAAGESRCDIYSIDGRTVACGVSNSAVQHLESGIYIVVEGGKATKVII